MGDELIRLLREKAIVSAAGRVAPPLLPKDITKAESCLEFTLPPILRQIYTEIGNGGFGPGYGLLPLVGGTRENPAIVDAYIQSRSYSGWNWPQGRLTVCDWGCAIASSVDCTDPLAPVFTFEHAPDKPMSFSFAKTHSTFANWLGDWLAGVDLMDLMFEDDPAKDRTGINPFTRQPMVFRARRLRRHEEHD
jgi:hypothetical protein